MIKEIIKTVPVFLTSEEKIVLTWSLRHLKTKQNCSCLLETIIWINFTLSVPLYIWNLQIKLRLFFLRSWQIKSNHCLHCGYRETEGAAVTSIILMIDTYWLTIESRALTSGFRGFLSFKAHRCDDEAYGSLFISAETTVYLRSALLTVAQLS